MHGNQSAAAKGRLLWRWWQRETRGGWRSGWLLFMFFPPVSCCFGKESRGETRRKGRLMAQSWGSSGSGSSSSSNSRIRCRCMNVRREPLARYNWPFLPARRLIMVGHYCAQTIHPRQVVRGTSSHPRRAATRHILPVLIPPSGGGLPGCTSVRRRLVMIVIAPPPAVEQSHSVRVFFTSPTIRTTWALFPCHLLDAHGEFGWLTSVLPPPSPANGWGGSFQGCSRSIRQKVRARFSL